MELMTFDLIDFMTQNTIISSKEQFRDLGKRHARNSDKFTDVNNESYEHHQVRDDKIKNKQDDMELYKYLESGVHNMNNISDDNQPMKQIEIGEYQTLSDIDAHFSKVLDGKRYDTEENGQIYAVKSNK